MAKAPLRQTISPMFMQYSSSNFQQFKKLSQGSMINVVIKGGTVTVLVDIYDYQYTNVSANGKHDLIT